MTLVAADRSVAVVIAPMCAIEDPRLAPWLSLTGIYRVEDPSGSIARVGEGKVIDRLRRHRAAPVLLPARVSAISQRVKQLEERMGTVLIERGTPCRATEKGHGFVGTWS